MLNQGNFYRDLLNDSSVSTNNLILTGNDANSVPYINAAKVLADRVLTDGQLLIGATGNAPLAGNITGSANIIITNGAGTIAADTVQPIATTSTPTFASETLSNTTNQLVLGGVKTTTISAVAPASSSVYTIPDAGTAANFVMTESAQTINGVISFGSAPKLTYLLSSRLLATNAVKGIQNVTIANQNGCNTTFAGNTMLCSMTQDLTTTANPMFAGLYLRTGGITTTIIPTETTDPRTYTIPDAFQDCNFLMTAGNQTITGTLILNTAPYFYTLTPASLLATNGSKMAQSVTIANGNGCNTSFSGSTLTANMTQNLDVSGSPTFVGLTASGTTASTLLATNTSKAIQSVSIQNQNGCNASFDGSLGLLTLTMTQDLRVTAVPSFNRINLTDSANQITMYQATLISSSNNAHTYTFQDMPDSNFVMSEGTQIINGSKTFDALSVTTTLRPTTDASVDVGSTSLRFKNLYLAGPVGGLAYMGQGIRTANRTELHLNANGDNVVDVFFGRDTRVDGNIKWGFSSRAAAETNNFIFYRCPYNTGAAFEAVYRVIGTTGQVSYALTTDATSATTGAVITAGGLGVAKKLFVGTSITAGTGILLPSSGGTPTLLNHYEEYTHTTNWNGAFGASSVAGNVNVIRTGKMVTATFPAILGTCTSTNPLWMVTNMPARFLPSSNLYIVAGIAQTAASILGTAIFYISSGGNWQIHNGTGVNFSDLGSPTVGLAYPCSVSWVIV